MTNSKRELMEVRKEGFRPRVVTGLSQRREMYATRLRKDNRCAAVASKRNKVNEAMISEAHLHLLSSLDPRLCDEKVKLEIKMEIIKNLLDCHKQDYDAMHALLKELRNYLSCDIKVNFEIAYTTGLIPILINCIGYFNTPISFEAIWSLINLAAMDREYCAEIVKYKGHIKIYKQIDNNELLENCIWVLTNIIEDSAEIRSEILALGFMNKLMQILEQKNLKISLLRVTTWSLSCIMKEKAEIITNNVAAFLKFSSSLLKLEDQEITQSVLKALYNLTLMGKHFIGSCISLLPFPELSSSHTLLALKVFGNLSLGPRRVIEAAIKGNVIPAIRAAIKKGSEEMAAEGTWIVANIVSNGCIEELIKEGVVEELYRLMEPGVGCEIKENVVTAIESICANGSLSQRLSIAEGDGLLALIAMLDEKNSVELLMKVLNSVENLLQIHEGEYENVCAMRFDSLGGVAQLEDLQMNSSIEIFKKVQSILDQYYYSDQSEMEFALAASDY